MKRKIMALSFFALFASLLLLQGCSSTVNYIELAGNTYTYTGESAYGIENDPFTISLNADGTFVYFESMFSSYMGIGEWSVKDNLLTLTENSEVCRGLKNSFRIDDGNLIFVESSSDNFPKVTVKDGEIFTGDTTK